MGLLTTITSVSAQVKGAREAIHKYTSKHKCLLPLVGLVTVHSNLNMYMKIRKSEIVIDLQIP